MFNNLKLHICVCNCLFSTFFVCVSTEYSSCLLTPIIITLLGSKGAKNALSNVDLSDKKKKGTREGTKGKGKAWFALAT